MHTLSFSSLPVRKIFTATLIVALMLAALPVMSASAGTITVNTTSDENTNNANCSLREAIIAANNNASHNGCVYNGSGSDDIITLTSGSTYTLSIVGSSATTGDLDIGDLDSGNLTIQTSGAEKAIIDANDINRVLEVGPDGNTSLTLVNISVTDGTAPDGAGIYLDGTGTLTLMNSTVSNNTATGSANCGAGIYNNTAATVNILNSTVESNLCNAVSGADGAGLFKGSDGTLNIENSTFNNNTAPDNGGGIHIDMLSGTAKVTNSTFSNNTAGGRGGGIRVTNGTVTVEFSTFSGNAANMISASTGGAIQATGGSVTVTRSILANSVAGDDCDQILPGTVSIVNSLVEDNSDCTGTITSALDPGLGALANNSGPTQTMAIGTSSPAYNTASSCGTITTDQRGVTRPQAGQCDLGAFEFSDASAPSVLSINRTNSSPTSLDSVGFAVTFSKAVVNVDISDFSLTTTGVTGAAITNVSGSGSNYTVTVDTGSNNGTIRLDIPASSDIEDSSGNPLSNVPFTSGQVYTVNKGGDTTGVFRPGNGVIFLKNQNTSGFADIELHYGNPGDYPIVGDWDGNGTDTIGVYRNGTFFLRNSNTVGIADLQFAFGLPGDQPIAGDWNNDGIDTIGIFRNGQFLLRNSNSAGPADGGSFVLGNPGDVGIAGDWNGDGVDTTGVFRPGNGVIYLKNNNSTGFADVELHYGIPGDKPVVGDWDGDGDTTIGVYRGGTFYLRNSNTVGVADMFFNLGNPGDMPIAGDWNEAP